MTAVRGSGRVAVWLAAAAAILLVSSHASARAQTRIELDATASSRGGGLACGIVAAAGWVTFHVDSLRSGPAPAGDVVHVAIQCPEVIRIGARYRLVLVTDRPRRGGWRAFSMYGATPSDGRPTYWALDGTRLRP